MGCCKSAAGDPPTAPRRMEEASWDAVSRQWPVGTLRLISGLHDDMLLLRLLMPLLC